jgi:hypothetical protein
MGYTKMSLSEKNWYFTKDAYHLYSTLSCIIYPKYCLSRLIASSSHRVYGIKFPETYRDVQDNGSTTDIIGVKDGSYDFCVKVIPEDDLYRIESSAIISVCNIFNLLYPSIHYAYGIHSLMTRSGDINAAAQEDSSLRDQISSISLEDEYNPIDDSSKRNTISADVQRFKDLVKSTRDCLIFTRQLF